VVNEKAIEKKIMLGKTRMQFTLSGPDLLQIARTLSTQPAFHKAPPDDLSIGDRKVKAGIDWASKLDQTKRTLRANWGELMHTTFSYAPPDIVSARIPDCPLEATAAINLIADLPFEVATFGSMHRSWYESYTPPGFSGLHALLGWACAFRGAGHDRLVSRRWLEYGPWRLIRADGDISFVQFHDLAADEETALAQAKPGHERMGISKTGGYLQGNYVYQTDVQGLYLAEERKLVITAVEPVSQLAMRDACAVRRSRRSDPNEPIDHIAYVFISEELARAHLHELWLRELECWALVEGQNLRLDEEYSPTPVRPDWVTRLG
jgi:hypothetical protein